MWGIKSYLNWSDKKRKDKMNNKIRMFLLAVFVCIAILGLGNALSKSKAQNNAELLPIESPILIEIKTHPKSSEDILKEIKIDRISILEFSHSEIVPPIVFRIDSNGNIYGINNRYIGKLTDEEVLLMVEIIGFRY